MISPMISVSKPGPEEKLKANQCFYSNVYNIVQWEE